MAMMRMVAAAVMAMLILADVAAADEAPISGIVKAVDTANQTVTLEVTGRGKTRQVVVHLKPGARVVKFVRASEPGKPGFVEQQLLLADVKAGWVVSVETKHEGDREVAELVKVVLERSGDTQRGGRACALIARKMLVFSEPIWASRPRCS